MLVKCKKPTVIDQNFALIPLSHGKCTIVDPEDFSSLTIVKWKAVKSSFCWYAVRDVVIDGQVFRIRMHRIISQTPDDQICHHKNRQSLDNRRKNLCNMSQSNHQALHDLHGHNRNQHTALQEPESHPAAESRQSP